jgi:DNA primase
VIVLYNEIKQSLGIIQVLEYYGIKLDHYNKTLCPIHNEKIKSFKVYPNRNRFKCFSCLASGSVIDFVVAYFNINNFEACKKLDEDFNLNLFKANLTNDEKAKMELNRKQIEKHLKEQKEIKRKKENKFIRVNEIFIEYDKLCERFKPKFPELPNDLFIFLNSQKEFWWEQLLKLE